MKFITKNYTDQQKRYKFLNNEIFSLTGSLLNQVKFSSNLNQMLYKKQLSFSFSTNIRNRCVVTGKCRSVFSKYKISRSVFNQKFLSGDLPGFYRSI